MGLGLAANLEWPSTFLQPLATLEKILRSCPACLANAQLSRAWGPDGNVTVCVLVWAGGSSHEFGDCAWSDMTGCPHRGLSFFCAQS
jgi:hypothetical protein